ncbi:hypothetical protein L211DRAFT_840221 [Terfezia boudieri ATCC MYA-4762]|uniref:Uncharacterized protein n=1 Tax=Terfezia boudieri ATCC MYA-4762 TaxID=1051890 RepID=A0A3N4LG57_9PEZI|nr:hypothetical protein L211DRAFT_840221 [Terfezia boudieri ATCC MYA-4762]
MSTDIHPPTPPSIQSSSTPLGLPAKDPHALTTHDTNILSLLFSDSESALPSSGSSSTSNPTVLIDPTLPPDPHIPADILPQLKQRETNAILEAEQAIKQPADETQTLTHTTDEDHPLRSLNSALATLDNLIKEFPNYASAYTNRAQLRRLILLQSQSTSTTFLPTNPTCALIEHDLQTSLTLSTPMPPSAPISTATATLLRTTYTHLATLYLLYSKSTSACTSSDQGLSGGAAAAGHWEEKASRAFELAGKYGSEIGRKMSVWTNPYAKTCGGMVREVLKREIEVGEEVGERLE